jgi:hypothetical protein
MPFGIKEVPGMRTQLKEIVRIVFGYLPVAEELIVILFDKSILALDIIMFQVCFVIPFI